MTALWIIIIATPFEKENVIMLMSFLTALAEEKAVSVADAAAANTTATAAAGTAAPAAAGAGDMISMVLMMVVMVAVFYFMLIRPQRKKDKAVKNMLDNLKKGDRVWTIGGFYATVLSIKEDKIELKLGDIEGTVWVKRSAIGGVENVKVENEAAPEI